MKSAVTLQQVTVACCKGSSLWIGRLFFFSFFCFKMFELVNPLSLSLCHHVLSGTWFSHFNLEAVQVRKATCLMHCTRLTAVSLFGFPVTSHPTDIPCLPSATFPSPYLLQHVVPTASRFTRMSCRLCCIGMPGIVCWRIPLGHRFFQSDCDTPSL